MSDTLQTTTIDELPSGGALSGNELLLIQQSDEEAKTTTGAIETMIKGNADTTPTADSDELVTSGGVAAGLSTINEKIPEEATDSNKLADKAFIATNYATKDTATATANGLMSSTDKAAFDTLTSSANPYVVATCNTDGDTQEKTVSITGFNLINGSTIGITFTNGNTYGDCTLDTPTYPTLSVNGGTAYPICDSRGHTAGKGCYASGDYIELRFVGDRFIIINSDIRQSVYAENGYVISSNNFIKQWGKVTGSITSGGGTKDISIIPMKDNLYSIMATLMNQNNGQLNLLKVSVNYSNISENNFTLIYHNTASVNVNQKTSWKVEGYIA